jgi:hypothetical protein
MRRIATLVATGALAAATAITMAASPASAGTAGTDSARVVAGGTARTQTAGGISALATHKWHSYNGSPTIYGWGTYSRTSASSKATGYVKDSRSGTYHAAIYLRWTQNGKSGYDWIAIANPHHHSTARFPHTYVSKRVSHLYVAEALSKYVKGKGWVITKLGHLHKIY